MTDKELAQGRLYPPLANIQEVSINIAVKVSNNILPLPRTFFVGDRNLWRSGQFVARACSYVHITEPVSDGSVSHHTFVHFLYFKPIFWGTPDSVGGYIKIGSQGDHVIPSCFNLFSNLPGLLAGVSHNQKC